MIPLHVHSTCSMLEGTLSLDKLIKRAARFHLNSIALTDTNGIYGLVQFTKKAVERNIKPLLGAFINVPSDDRLNCVLLARNNEGYSDLCKIVTYRKLNDNFSLPEILNSKSKNLFIITTSLELLKGLKKFNNVFAGLVASKKFRTQNRELYNYAQSKNISVTACDPIFFLDKEDYLLHKVVTAIRLNKNLDNLESRDVVDEEFYFKSPVEIKEYWKSLPDILKTCEFIADNCNVDLELNKYKFPVFPVPDGETSSSYLWKIAYEGLLERYQPLTDAAKKRFEYEFSVIREMNFEDYFLIVWNIVGEAKKRGMMTIGRGSAANSLVAYCLGLTQVDPVKYNLYFERFLNKGRSNPPDVDIDFSWKERDEIIKYVFDKYGYENVAMISTHVTFKARSAFREVAKVFGFTDNEISRYSKLIPWTSAENLPNVAELYPESKALNFKIEPWKTIVDIASKIAGFPRHLSIHPGGIVITPGPVTNFTALEYAKNKGFGLIITQPDMYSIEELGLIKIDLLSQRSLGVLRDTMEMINKREEEI
jgi:DNA-directed DNA polymerase III PolC